jgi:hypothetical protein
MARSIPSPEAAMSTATTVADRPTTAMPHAAAVPYRSLYPAWEGPRPLAWFFAEQLLEARAESEFPTNAAGADEDVNVYLVDLLCRWAGGATDPALVAGRTPLVLPPEAAGTSGGRAGWYRRQADHRLLALGLFDRGDLIRRRACGWAMTPDQTDRSDREVARTCYALAADLIEGRAGDRPGVVQVWRKLARDLDRYVHVLQTLARRRLGLGATIGDDALARLLAGGAEG